jgi:hypothetical protein
MVALMTRKKIRGQRRYGDMFQMARSAAAFRGLPRGRRVHSNPSSFTIAFCQSSSPIRDSRGSALPPLPSKIPQTFLHIHNSLFHQNLRNHTPSNRPCIMEARIAPPSSYLKTEYAPPEPANPPGPHYARIRNGTEWNILKPCSTFHVPPHQQGFPKSRLNVSVL